MDRPSATLPWTIGLVVTVLLLGTAPAHAAGAALEIYPDPLQLVILILIFIALIFPVNRLVVQPLIRVLAERAERIEGARQRAAQISREAEESLARYQNRIDAESIEAEVGRRSMVAEAREEQAALTGEARQASESELERARTEIQAALQEARASLQREAELLAREAVSRILGRPLS